MRTFMPMALLGAVLAATAGAQTRDHAPTGLSSAPELRHDKGESWTYIKPGLSLTRYRSVLIEPTLIYRGPDAQFQNIEPADRDRFATLLTEALRSELAKSPGTATRAGPGVLRLKMTLLGAEKTTGGVSTAAHVMPLGLVSNAVKSVAGKRGSFTGSILLAIEVTDGATGELLAAAVRREAPDALDIGATTSTTDTVKSVARSVAKHVREKLETGMHRR